MSNNLLFIEQTVPGTALSILQVYQFVILTTTFWEALFWLSIAG